MRFAIGLTAGLVALGALSCGDSEPSNGTSAGGAGGTGGAGGSGGSGAVDGGADSGGVSADQACTETARALCSKYDTCAPYAIQILFGDVDTCNSVAKTGCLGSLQADDT